MPHIDIHADQVVEFMLSILQAAIVPNAFFSLLTAIITLSKEQIKKLAGCFIKTVAILWGIVIITLFGLWLIISHTITTDAVLPTFNYHYIGITALIPIMMLLAIIFGSIISITPKLQGLVSPIKKVQYYVSLIFEYIFLLIPILVFFVMYKFLGIAGFEHSMMALNYFLLALIFVALMNIFILPCLFRFVLGVPFAHYTQLVGPVFLMTFLAGDSIAAIPLIARAADTEASREKPGLSRIITLVVISFPWIGELANLVFPIYSATLEGYGLSTILSILSVGPFFMFTDPYISIPSLLSVLDFPKLYQVTYLTLALLTDHMFEVCEAVAVLYCVIRLRKVID